MYVNGRRLQSHTLPCPGCQTVMHLGMTSDWRPIYVCPACDRRVGAHATGRPVLVRTSMQEARARAKAHLHFDRLWQEGHMSRVQAYQWLASVLAVPSDEAHISQLDEAQCLRLVALTDEYLQQLAPTSERGSDHEQ